ncbi:MAG TPA: beta-propeller fold lactonase family protein [Terracidiphilus sp.]|nr:beta-propeller fold lactonase family protein [Terracidiphilus sp.]
MKLNKPSQLVLVSAAGLLLASLVTACQQFTQTLTVDFVYVASAKAAGPNNYGEIDVLEINSESGFLRRIPDSPFPSQGRNPVAEAVSADYSSLFVVNQDDNTVVQFVIGSDGKLYPYNTVNTPGVFPLATVADASNLFVLDSYQPLPTCNSAAPCSGSIAVYPLTAATKSTPVAMGSPAINPANNSNYWPLLLPGAPADVMVPTGVAVLGSGSYVYVSAYDSTAVPSTGYVFGFSVGSNGVLTAVSGSPWAAGRQPSAVASDPTGSYLYVTDFGNGGVLGYSISSGALTPLSGSPFPSGNQPSAIAVNPTYPYLYVTNSLDGTVTAYSESNGALTRLGSFSTGLDPVAIGIDPSTNRFLYTANFLGNNVNNYVLTTNDGSLQNAQYSPYGAHPNPTAVAAIPHNGTGAGIKK